MPLGVVKGKGISEKVDFFISYKDNYTIYELSFHKTLENEFKLIYDSIKYEYFIFNNKDSFGFNLKSLNDSFRNKLDRDSILKGRGFDQGKGNYDVFKDIKVKSKSLIYMGINKKYYSYILENIFYDSAHLYFDDNLKDIQFSISKPLDSIYNSKLIKFQLFLKQDSLVKANPELKNFFVSSIQIKKEKSSDEQSLINLFKRFEMFDKSQK